MFADLAQGVEWTAFARAALEHEMDVQVLPDGADYESSVPYHRLVAELFLGAARSAEHDRTAAVGRVSLAAARHGRLPGGSARGPTD